MRQLEIINKFDNGLSGVAGDGGTTGTITNGGNFLSTGSFWDLEPCEDPDNHDHSPTALEHNDDELLANGLNADPRRLHAARIWPAASLQPAGPAAAGRVRDPPASWRRR